MAKEQFNKDCQSDEYFLSNGYRRYEKTRLDNECVECIFQKRFDDNNGQKYFITIKKWNWERYKDKLGNAPLVTYEYDTQLYKKDTHNAVDIEWHTSWNLEDVEKMAEDLWDTGWFEHYEEWDI